MEELIVDDTLNKLDEIIEKYEDSSFTDLDHVSIPHLIEADLEIACGLAATAIGYGVVYDFQEELLKLVKYICYSMPVIILLITLIFFIF